MTTMADSQWPQFQVFEQPAPGEPHQNAGAVHAPDPEMALLIARDVFARRPWCVGLWVVPVEAITSRTAQELAEPTADGAPGGGFGGPPEPYGVFCKREERGTHVFAGTVEAGSPAEALERARARFDAGPGRVLVWWLCPSSCIVSSDPAEADSFFAPAKEKTYRDQADYHTVSLMHQVKRARDGGAAPR
jgi:ring-1,2-phenylacetyl-CoA epoxidase subunit PaaB